MRLTPTQGGIRSHPYDLKTRVSANLTLDQASDGSITATAAFDSKYPECITPSRIRFHGGQEPTPELYYFQFPGPGFVEGADFQIRLPRVGEHTYKVHVPGNTLVPGVFYNSATTEREIGREPLSNASYVNFSARTQTTFAKVMRHGKKLTVKCIGSQVEDAKFPLLGKQR